MGKKEHLEGSNRKTKKRLEKGDDYIKPDNFSRGSSKRPEVKSLGHSYDEVFNRIAKEYKGYIDPKDMSYDDKDPEFMAKVQRNAEIKEEIIRKVNAELKIGTYTKPAEQPESAMVPQTPESATIEDSMVKETPKIEEDAPKGLGKGDGEIPEENPIINSVKAEYSKPRSTEGMPYAEKIVVLGEEIAKGVDVVVIHGKEGSYVEIGTGIEKVGLTFERDHDTNAALYFLNKAGIEYKSVELVNKGGKSESTEPGRYLHVDTSGESVGVAEDVDGRTLDIYSDHHQEGKGNKISATDIIYKALVYAKKLEYSEEDLRLVGVINAYDNLSYVDEKYFNKEYYTKYWAKSVVAMAKYVTFEQLLKWVQENKYNSKGYFIKENSDKKVDLQKGVSIKDVNKNPIKNPKISDLSSRLLNEVRHDNKGIAKARKEMENEGILLRTDELGEVVFTETWKVKSDKEGEKDKLVNYIANGFVATKANGFDTFATLNSTDGKIFINSTTKNLEPLFNRIKAKYPNTVMVRGVMIISKEGGQNITKEEFLDLLGIAPRAENKKVAKINKLPKQEVMDKLASGKLSMADALAMGYTIEDLTVEGTVEENAGSENNNENILIQKKEELDKVRKERDTLMANYNARAKAREEEIKKLEEELKKMEEEENKVNNPKKESPMREERIEELKRLGIEFTQEIEKGEIVIYIKSKNRKEFYKDGRFNGFEPINK